MKVMGIDYGREKIGVAIGETETRMAEPLKTVKNLKFLILNPSTSSGQVLKSILNDQLIKKIVIGVPGGKMDEEIKVFGEKIAKETGLPVEYFDETLSTQDAQRLLIESGRNRKRRKGKEDAVAAAIMLQYYLETCLC